MTSPDTPMEPQQADLRAELGRIEAERSVLLNAARELRDELDEGPLDGNERAALITRAEELEAFAAELERRREALLEKLSESP